MRMEDLVGRCVDLTVSDPWDWVTDNGSGPFEAEILAVKAGDESDQWLKLRVTISTIAAQPLEMYASTRFESESFLALAEGNSPSASLYYFGYTVADKEGFSRKSRPAWGLIGSLKLK